MNTGTMTIEQYESIKPITKVKFRGQELNYWTPNRIAQMRALSLFGPNLPMSERETVRWINSMNEGDVLIDIGANVGSYTVYAAKLGVKVLAIEPEAKNYSALTENIRINGLDKQVTAVCVGLSDVYEVADLHVGSPELGQSCHSVGVAESINGAAIDPSTRTRQSVMSYRLDDLLKMIDIGEPTHIKIDVDGIEQKVVMGMLETLDVPSLKSVQIELMPDHPEHGLVRKVLEEKGFSVNPEQVRQSTIEDEGPFAGMCNVIFHRAGFTEVDHLWPNKMEESNTSLLVDDEVILSTFSKIRDAEVMVDPTPHFLIEDVFPEKIYEKITQNLPPANLYVPMDDMGWTAGAHHRDVFAYRDDFLTLLSEDQDAFVRSFISAMMSEDLLSAAASRFAQWIPELQGDESLNGFTIEACLTKDHEGYAIGPHSDSVDRVLSLLYYLPKSEECIDSGTSLYEPKESGFECQGGKWHDFEGFEEAKRIPYKPNTLFGFVKTSTSFHGVAPLPAASIDRDVLHITLHLKARKRR